MEAGGGGGVGPRHFSPRFVKEAVRLAYHKPDVDDGADRPAPDEIEVTSEMVAAGAAVVERCPSGDSDPFYVAEKVFRAMLEHWGRRAT